MSSNKPDSDGRNMDQWIKSTRLVKDWEEKKSDILTHKWYESEKAGRDIGWDHASVDWLIRHGIEDSKK